MFQILDPLALHLHSERKQGELRSGAPSIHRKPANDAAPTTHIHNPCVHLREGTVHSAA